MNLFELFVKIGVDDQASDKLSKLSNSLGKGLATAAKIGSAAVGVAAAGITALTTQAVNSFAEYEQLAGGAQKIFDQMDYSKIATDANNAYKELGLSASQYLAVINDVGATFAATMGDEAGYEAAKTGLKAISDYASGTGKNVDELSQKFTLITRSTSSYQSIADQFSGILPATSAEFLKQAQAAGILSDKYTQLTEVPIDEYQAAVSKMLEQGVKGLGLANNTMNEAFSTLSGSLSMAKGAWSNLVTGLADDSADLDMLIGNFVESVGAVATNLIPKIGTALNGASKLVRDLIPVIVQEIPVLIEENLPILAEAAVSIIQSLMDGISGNQEVIFSTVFDVITYLANSFITMLPQIVQLGLDLIVSLANGIAQNAGTLWETISQTIQSIVDVFLNNLPQIIQLGLEFIVSLANGISQNIGTLIPTIISVISQIFDTLTSEENLSILLDAALTIILSLVQGLVDAIPSLIDAVIQIINNFIDFLLDEDNLTKIIEAVVQIIIAIAEGLVKAIPQLVQAVVTIIEKLCDFFLDPENILMLLDMAFDVVTAIAEGLVKAIPELLKGAVELVGSLIDSIVNTDWLEVGKNIVIGVLDGLKEMWDSLTEWFGQAWDGLVNGTKDALGIHSPSRVFAGIGKNMALGVGEGWDNEFEDIKKNIDGSMSFDGPTISNSIIPSQKSNLSRNYPDDSYIIGNVNITINGAKYSDEQSLAEAVAEALQEMTYRREAVYA